MKPLSLEWPMRPSKTDFRHGGTSIGDSTVPNTPSTSRIPRGFAAPPKVAISFILTGFEPCHKVRELWNYA